jgi:hypothetical protein
MDIYGYRWSKAAEAGVRANSSEYSRITRHHSRKTGALEALEPLADRCNHTCPLPRTQKTLAAASVFRAMWSVFRARWSKRLLQASSAYAHAEESRRCLRLARVYMYVYIYICSTRETRTQKRVGGASG